MSSLPLGFHALARTAEIGTKPRRATFAGLDFVLFRGLEGRVHALLDRCPHRGVPLSAGRVCEGVIACAYHGYRFDGEGRCVHLPGLDARARIPTALSTPSLHVVERDGFAWAQARAWGGQSAPPRLPHLDDPAFHTFVWSFSAQGKVIDGLENFLDATHTHFVHAGLIRRASRRRPVVVQVRRDGPVAEARYGEVAAPESGSAGLFSRLFARGIDGRFGRFIAPCVAQLEYRRGDATAMAISALFTPRSERNLSVWAVVTTRRVAGVPAPLVRSLIKPFFALAILQDRRILSLQARALKEFPSFRPAISPTDVLRPHIEQLLQHGPSPEPFSKQLTLTL